MSANFVKSKFFYVLTALIIILNSANLQAAAPDDWVVPGGIQNQMIAYVQANQDGSQIATSEGSKLSVWAPDGSIAGSTDVITGPMGKLFSCTVFSNQTSVSGMTMKVYDAASDKVYDLQGTIDFLAGSSVGSLFSPEVFNTAAETSNSYTVTFNAGEHGSIASGEAIQVVEEGQPAEAPAITAESGWVFTGWDKSFSNVTEDMTVTAQYREIENYTVTFDPGQNGIITSGELVQEVEYGNAATEPVVVAKTGWNFTGWDVSFSYVTSDLTVTAQYESAVGRPDWPSPTGLQNSMIVYAQVKNGQDFIGDSDTSMLSAWTPSGDIAGSTEVFSGPAGMAFMMTVFSESSYVSGMSLKVYDAAEDKIYKIQETFDFQANSDLGSFVAPYILNIVPEVKTYTVTFTAGSHGTITGGNSEQTVVEGADAVSPEITPDYGWEFSGWDSSFTNITSDVTVTALYTPHEWTVTFTGGDHGSLSGETIQTVPHQGAAIAPGVSADEGWVFSGWSRGFNYVTENITVTAQYDRKTFNVSFNPGDHGIITSGNAQQVVAYGESAAAPTVIAATGWVFDKWDKPLSNITSDRTINALYKVAEFTVIFDAGDHGFINGQRTFSTTVTYGQSATAPEVTVNEGWIFQQWQGDYSNITSDITIYASYTHVPMPDIAADTQVEQIYAGINENVQVSFAISNTGDLATGDIVVDFQKYTNGNWITTAGGRQTISSLAAGESRNESFAFFTDDRIESYQFRLFCDSVYSINESNENNNISAIKTVTVSMPELEVESLVLSPENCVSQQQVTVSGWFKNSGNKAATATCAIYVKEQSVWVNIAQQSWEFAAGQRRNLTVAISGYELGQYEFKAVIDETGEVDEITETNNVKDGVILTIADPDLKVLSITADHESVLPSEVTTLKIDIYNDSFSKCIWPFAVSVEIQDGSGNWSNIDTVNISEIAGKQNKELTVEYTAPSEFGSYQFRATIDSLQEITESNELNNSLIDASITVEDVDLVASNIFVGGNGKVGVPFDVNWTATNMGETRSNFLTWRDVVYISDSPDFEQGNKRVIGTDILSNMMIEAGGSYDAFASCEFINGDEGQKFIFIRLNNTSSLVETDYVNNVAGPFAVDILPSDKSDLYPVSLYLPAIVETGQQCQVSWTAVNQGNNTTSNANGVLQSSWYDKLYLSSDNTISGDDIVLGQALIQNSVEAGSNYSKTKIVTIPMTVAEGDYYIIVALDSNNNVYESDDNNNIIVSNSSFSVKAGEGDVTGPWVTDISVAGTLNAPFNSFEITFSEQIDASTFTTEDIAFVSSSDGSIDVSTISAVEGSGGSRFLLSFAQQDTDNNYVLRVGPEVSDISGNQMDQDMDLTAGENNDYFEARFSLQMSVEDTISPFITSVYPLEFIDSIDRIYVQFSEAMDSSTIDFEDFILTDSDGQQYAGIGWNFEGSSTYRINFANIEAAGQYTLNIYPYMSDLYGNSLDQDGDGVGGQLDSDIYTDDVSLTITIDNTAPYLIGLGTTGFDEPVSSITAVFSEEVIFGVGDIAITDPDGYNVPVISVVQDSVAINKYNVTIPSQSIEGIYSVDVSAANITDGSGNGLIEDWSGEFTIDYDSGSGGLEDIAGPVVIDVKPDYEISLLSYVEVYFNEAIDRDSLQVSDFVLTDPLGNAVTINDIIKYSDSVYRIFPVVGQSRIGSYGFAVLPSISDISGNLMNQDQDQINGEVGSDGFSQTINIIGYPDLEIASYDISTVAVNGQALPISLEVVNNGLGAVYNEIYRSGWTDSVVLSSDMIYGNSDDINLGTFVHGGDLASGSSYQINDTVNIPEWVFGNFNLIVMIDKNDNITELENDDNILIAPIRVRTVDVGLASSDITYMPLAPSLETGFVVSANIHNYSEQSAVADVYFYDGQESQDDLIAVSSAVTIEAESEKLVSAPNYTTDIEGGHKLIVVLENISPTDRISTNNKASRYIVVGPVSYELSVSMDSFQCWPGAELDIPVTIRNTGANPLTINQLSVQSDIADWFSLDSNVQGTVLGVGDSITAILGLSVTNQQIEDVYEYLCTVTVQTNNGIFTDQAMVELLPEPESTIEVRLFEQDTEKVLRGAMVMIDGNSDTYYTDYYGMVNIPAAAGSTKLYFYAENHHPKAVEIDAAPGENSLTEYLEEGVPLEVQSVVVRRLTAQEIVDRGVDLADPENYWIYDFEIDLGLNSSGASNSGSSGSSLVVPSVPMPLDIDEPVTFRRYIPANEIADIANVDTSSGYTVIGHIRRYQNNIDPEARVETYMIIPGDVRFAKEFFDVTTVIINNAQAPDPEDITIENTTATINLPAGISLPELFGSAQSATQLLSDDGILLAGEKAQATWTIRGDYPGKYVVSVDASGNIQPFDIDLAAYGESDEFEVAYPSYYMVIDYPDEVYKDQEFDLDIYIENTNTSSLNFATVTLDTELMRNARLTIGENSSKTITEILPQETGKFTFTMISEVNGRVVVKETAMEEKLFVTANGVSISEAVIPEDNGGITKGEPLVISGKGFEGFVEIVGAAADAGEDINGYVGDQIQLDGSGSSNADQYLWEIISRPIGSTAVIADPENMTTIFVPDVSGQYVFQLSVASAGLWGQSDTVSLTAEYKYHTITASVDGNGTVSPEGQSSVREGDDFAVTMNPDTGYYISDVIVDGISQSVSDSYTFYDVQQDHSIVVKYLIYMYDVEFNSGEHGMLTGELSQTVSYGSFAIAPSVEAEYGWDFAGWDVSFDSVTSDLTVTATYSRHAWTVSFLAGDHGSLSGDTVQQVTHESSAAAPTVTPAYGWDFTGWDVSFDSVTSDLTVTATYSRHAWIVSFLAGDHGSLSGDTIQQVAHESSAAAPTVTPAYGWDFAGWNVSFDSVTSDLTVTATYSRHAWTVSFLGGDHGSLSGDTIQQVTHESSAAAPAVTPAYGWDFAGWDVSFDSVTSDLTVTATYSRHAWTVSFLAGDHGSLSGDTIQQVTHESSATAPVVEPDHGWDFAGWDISFDNVTSDLTVTATYSRHGWLVRFLAGEHGSLTGDDMQNIAHEGNAAPPQVTPAYGWDFAGWDKSFDNVTNDLTITATYARHEWTVSFAAGQHGVVAGASEHKIAHEDSATAPDIISDHGWDFTGWDSSIANVTADMVVTATYARHEWTVTYTAGGYGELIGETVQYILHESGAIAPVVRSDKEWCFAGWDSGFDIVTDDIVVSATYVPRNMDVADLNDDGIVDDFDLFLLSDQWLINDCQVDIHADNLVNLTDYAIFSDFWLDNATVKLELSLVPGWNWVSFNVLPEQNDVSNTLSDYVNIARNQDFIVSANGNNATYYEGNWYGTLKDIEPGKMYKIRSHLGGNFAVEGNYVDASKVINLVKGWNWIGYCLEESKSLAEALSNLNAQDNDYIVSPEGQNATYWGGQWYGTLKELRPGTGYMLRIKQATTFSYASDITVSSIKAEKALFKTQEVPLIMTQGVSEVNQTETIEWQNPEGMAYSMAAYAKLDTESGLVISSDSVLSAWKDGEMLGCSKLCNGPYGDLFILVIFSHEPELSAIEFKLYQPETDEVLELGNGLDFVSDDIIGSIEQPILVGL
ncbi:MAG: CARDB domain-containing protein [Sedimentisphaeraceae bacterium JB056]